jgi:hypothetical protein
VGKDPLVREQEEENYELAHQIHKNPTPMRR